MNLDNKITTDINLSIIKFILVTVLIVFFMYHAGKAIGKFIYFLQN